MLRRICRDCGQRHGAVRFRVHQHAVLCEPCFDVRNEAADARRQRQYYGSSTPQTVDELEKMICRAMCSRFEK